MGKSLVRSAGRKQDGREGSDDVDGASPVEADPAPRRRGVASIPSCPNRVVVRPVDGAERPVIECRSTLLEDLAGKESEKFATFWKQFGRVLKEGVVEDTANRERIAKLLRFSSTHRETEEQTVSLADYVGRMKEKQTTIYFITADGFAAAKNSPHL